MTQDGSSKIIEFSFFYSPLSSVPQSYIRVFYSNNLLIANNQHLDYHISLTSIF